MELTPIRGSDDFIYADSNVKVSAIPVERYVEEDVLCGRTEYLVAFDPNIRKLLHINEDKLKSEIRHLNKMNDDLLKNKKFLVNANLELANKLDKFEINISTMNFFKRLVFLFTGKINMEK